MTSRLALTFIEWVAASAAVYFAVLASWSGDTLDIALAAANAVAAAQLRSLAFSLAAGRRIDAMLAALRDIGRS